VSTVHTYQKRPEISWDTSRSTDNSQRIFSTLSTVNFQRSFSVSDGNALTFNAFKVEKIVNRQRLPFFLPTTKTFNDYFFKFYISVNFQRFKIEG
jgi:hypothetical protein